MEAEVAMVASMEAEVQDWEPVEPQTLIQGLKCPVCWDYFTRPHTIPCGHTFCTRCLQTLARVSRTSRTRTPLDRLRFNCPSCRKKTLARPILRRKAAVNYAIKELVDEWFNSPYSSGSVDYITLRSIASQTEDVDVESTNNTENDTATSTGRHSSDISNTEFREILFHKIDSKASLGKSSVKEPLDLSTRIEEADTTGIEAENAVTSSSDESESETEIGMLFGNLQVVNDDNQGRRRFARFDVTSVSGVLMLFFAQCAHIFHAIRESRSRTVLTIFWFLYGGIIVYISHSFLPWMSFYTVIYFIIIYAELTPPDVPI